MQSVVEPGTMLGPAARFSGIPVVAVASHDTASAVAAVPAREMNWAFISSGTWSIMGVETAAPVIDERTRTLNWTNEGGPGRTFRLSKNISGLWLLQQCRKTWDAGRSYSYDDLVRLAGTEPPFRSFIDPDAPDFLNPPDMPDAIRKFCRRRGQPEPRSPAETTRCILESLALKSRFVLDELRQISPHPIEKIHIIGGGVRNALLCRLTAEATRLPVSAGPAEATAVGNIMIQALASGAVGSSAELRDLVARSVRPVEYEPGLRDAWEEAYARFLGMLAGGPD